jgi:hypothetical protein
MAKKSMMSEAADAVKSIAGAALGAAAVAATGVVVDRMAGAMTKGGQKLEEAAPSLEKATAQKLTAPILPKPQKRAAAKKKATSAKKKKTTSARKKKTSSSKKKIAAKRTAKKKRTPARKKR